MNTPAGPPWNSFDLNENHNPRPLEEYRPPFLPLFAATGLFTLMALVLITFTLVIAAEPLRAVAQAAKNAKAAPNQPAANVLAKVQLNTTNVWIVFGLIATSSAALLLIAWLTLRDTKQKSMVRTSPTVYAVVAITFLGMALTLLKNKDLPPELSSFMLPFLLTMVAIPFPLSYVTIRCFACRLGRGMERINHSLVGLQNLPGITRRFFERFTPEMEAMGFRQVGDYRLKRRTPFFCRVLLSEDQQTFGEITTQQLLSFFPLKCCAFATIFESGDYLETANIVTKTHQVGRFHTRSLPTSNLEKLYAAHRQAVVEISERNETYPVECSPEDYPKISLYGHKLMYDRLVEEGIATRNIYEPETVETT